MANPALIHFIADPNHTILLLLVGILFIYAEFNKPGTVLFGCFGLLLTMFALYGLAHVPLAQAAVVLSLLSVAVIVVSCRYKQGIFLALLGYCGLGWGLNHLVLRPAVRPPIAWAATTIFTFVTTWLVRIALLARQNKVQVGPQAFIGRLAVVHTPLTPAGKVEVRGELWPAVLAIGGYQPIGASVAVLGVHDLQLLVAPNPAHARSAE